MWCLQWTKEDGLRQAAVANQFIPLNTNPKEVLEMRNKVSHKAKMHIGAFCVSVIHS